MLNNLIIEGIKHGKHGRSGHRRMQMELLALRGPLRLFSYGKVGPEDPFDRAMQCGGGRGAQ